MINVVKMYMYAGCLQVIFITVITVVKIYVGYLKPVSTVVINDINYL